MARKEYKTVRIYPDDAEQLRALAFRTNSSIVGLVSLSTKVLHRAYWLAKKRGQIKIDGVIEDILDKIEKEYNEITKNEKKNK